MSMLTLPPSQLHGTEIIVSLLSLTTADHPHTRTHANTSSFGEKNKQNQKWQQMEMENNTQTKQKSLALLLVNTGISTPLCRGIRAIPPLLRSSFMWDRK